ncbi:hypothetical protein IW261DRAFT_1421657 [Armillaria novae-zelandiae]|uniref:Uncharacterized protein n=1 Tax=Armillaria novae-zelandiae TaxID=153914 RepID=A0AA39P2X2_9AGAR|nr:hypothetical protein IW261DRAFT_1421657 [Armillaria novae-zelandiae]
MAILLWLDKFYYEAWLLSSIYSTSAIIVDDNEVKLGTRSCGCKDKKKDKMPKVALDPAVAKEYEQIRRQLDNDSGPELGELCKNTIYGTLTQTRSENLSKFNLIFASSIGPTGQCPSGACPGLSSGHSQDCKTGILSEQVPASSPQSLDIIPLTR